MFSISKEYRSGIETILLKKRAGQLYAEIVPAWGGIINKLYFNSSCVLKGYNNYLDFKKNAGIKFINALLFPFPNRINNGTYTFNKISYRFSDMFLNEKNAIHGILYNKPFKVSSITNDKKCAAIALSYNYRGENDGYPFHFNFTVKYLFYATKVSIQIIIKNTGSATMPFGIGLHPYFNCTEKINSCRLQLPQTKKIMTNRKQIPTGKTELYSQFEKKEFLSDKKFDSCYRIKKHSATVGILETASYEVAVRNTSIKNRYDFLQLYTPPDRESICIEPMTCAPDALNNGMGLKELKPNNSFRIAVSFTFRKKNN